MAFLWSVLFLFLTSATFVEPASFVLHSTMDTMHSALVAFFAAVISDKVLSGPAGEEQLLAHKTPWCVNLGLPASSA